MRIIILIEIPMWLFPHNRGSEQLRFGASKTAQGDLEQFLASLRFENRGKVEELMIRYNGKACTLYLRKNIKMVSTKAEVLEVLEKNKAKINAFGVRQFSLFGSFLYDQATAESDVDLLVEFEPDKKTFTNFSNLVFFLEELLGRHVEVVTKESLSPYIGPHILRDAEHVTISA